MSIKDQMTKEQWQALLNAPAAAADYVATASGGGLETLSELLTSIKVVQETALRDSGSGFGKVVDELLKEMQEMSFADAKADSMHYEAKDMASLREEAKKVVGDAASAVAAMDGGDGFKRWLLYIARKVAETKTGGVLGFGGTSVVDDQEKAALAELSALLGVLEY